MNTAALFGSRAMAPVALSLALSLALALAGLLSSAPSWGQAASSAAPRRTPIVLVDRIVAVVNNEVVTQLELRDRLQRVMQDLQFRNTSPPDRELLERQVLERIIIERVQLQHASDTALRVDDVQLDQAVARVAASNNLSLPEFRAVLAQEKILIEKFREDLRTEIVISRLRDREVENRITVSESEIDNYLADEQTSKAGAEEYNISHILVRLPEQASPEQIERQRARVEEALKRLRGGADFGQVSAAFSDAPEALTGGEMGWRGHDRLPELFAQALVKMKPGSVSEVLRSPAGFHLLRLNDQRGAGAAAMVEQTRVRHILVRVNELVSESEAQRKLANLRERIVNGVDFAELARLNSDDGSAARGGDLGWIFSGDTVPEFERAMRALKVGELGQPIKSQFGWHLIQVQERRMADMASDRKRLEARKVLRERKSDEAYQEWLRQLRDRAYVEYRTDER